MTSLLIFVRLLLSEPLTTDDTWDCYRNSDGVEVCEREISPCHYERSPADCVIRVIKLPTVVTEVSP